MVKKVYKWVEMSVKVHSMVKKVYKRVEMSVKVHSIVKKVYKWVEMSVKVHSMVKKVYKWVEMSVFKSLAENFNLETRESILTNFSSTLLDKCLESSLNP